MPAKSNQRRLRLDGPTLCGLGAIVCWSTTVAVARSLTEQLGQLTAAAAVYVAASLFCLAPFIRGGDLNRRIWRLPRAYLFVCGALFVLYMTLLYVAIGRAEDRRQVLEIGLVNYLWCTLTILFSLLLLNKRAGLLVIPGTALALGGVFLVLTQGEPISWSSFVANVGGNPAAYSLALIGAVAWALYSNLTRRLAGAENTGGVLVFIPATAFVLLFLLLCNPERSAWTGRAAGEALFLGLMTALGYYLWDIAMRRGDVVLVLACSYVTPLLSTLLCCAYLAILPGASLWVGCLAIVGGSLLSWISVTDRTPAPVS